MILTSLMKLAVKDMTTKHDEIKEFMLKVESSSDYFIHKIAECSIGCIKNSFEMPSTPKPWLILTRSSSTIIWPFLNNMPIITLTPQPRSILFRNQISKNNSNSSIKSLKETSQMKASAETNRTYLLIQKRILVQTRKSMGKPKESQRLIS